MECDLQFKIWKKITIFLTRDGWYSEFTTNTQHRYPRTVERKRVYLRKRINWIAQVGSWKRFNDDKKLMKKKSKT